MRYLLGGEGNLGAMLGLRNDFMASVIRQVGNYGEIFDRNLRPLNLVRGMNALWTAGGLLYAPPFR
jgi:general L-amino acid transport system substrate-binding protein